MFEYVLFKQIMGKGELACQTLLRVWRPDSQTKYQQNRWIEPEILESIVKRW